MKKKTKKIVLKQKEKSKWGKISSLGFQMFFRRNFGVLRSLSADDEKQSQALKNYFVDTIILILFLNLSEISTFFHELKFSSQNFNTFFFSVMAFLKVFLLRRMDVFNDNPDLKLEFQNWVQNINEDETDLDVVRAQWFKGFVKSQVRIAPNFLLAGFLNFFFLG
jgi:hypothetical protein